MSSKEETRKKILEAALELFSENGYEGTTTRSIAEKSGVNELTIFRHFDNKKNLFLTCIDEKLDSKEKLKEIDIEPSEDLKEDLTKIGLEIGKKFIENSELMKIMLMETKRTERVSHVPEAVHGLLKSYLNEAEDKGLIKAIDKEMASITFFSFFFRVLVSDAFLGKDPLMEFNEDNVRRFVELLVDNWAKEVE
ncbi:MAG: TetR/AcrR family transcriptional regulator [Candidatus Thermoplasmatota archaeon]|nr:TetR/AcrR family transcriptional regulator [Candidatus Thermoplasmatota archaeon]